MVDSIDSGWHSRGYFPHFDLPQLIQHVTFRLADSLPQAVIHKMQLQLADYDDEAKAIEKRKRINQLLDAGFGSCILTKGNNANLMQETLLHFDTVRYRICAWVIMPNHVHVLVKTMDEFPLAKIVQSWKRFFATSYRKTQNGTDVSKPLWQRDYFDRYIRDEKHYLTTLRYIENNPVAAGLVNQASDWKYSSAYTDNAQ